MNRIFILRKLFLILIFLSVVFLMVQPAYAAENSSSIQARTVQNNLNMIWVLVAAALVFFMQAGFMCLESGLTEAKNSINVAIKNLADFVIAAILFWFLGFGVMFGDSLWGLVGTSNFMIETFQENFGGLAREIGKQDTMAEAKSAETNRFQKEFREMMKTAGMERKEDRVVKISGKLSARAV